MRFIARSLTGLFLLALTLGLLGVAAITVKDAVTARQAKGERPRVARERVFSARVLTVEPGIARPVIEAIGEVQARRALDVRTPFAGTIAELGPNFVEGGEVAEGELLAALDTDALTDALALARTDLAEAQAEQADAAAALALARDELAAAERQAQLRAASLARTRALAERGSASAAAVENAELALAAAEQTVLARRQALAQAETRVARAETALQRRQIALRDAERKLADARITAQFAGVLSNVSAVRGGLVGPNERIARLVDPTALDVAFRVSAAQYRNLTRDGAGLPALPVSVKLDILGDTVTATGTVSREGAVIAAGTSGRQLFAALAPQAARAFRVGDFVTVRIEEPPLRGVAIIPARAVDAAGKVLVLGPEDRLEEAQVEVLRRQGDTVIIRAPGLHGREIVAERTPLIGAGVRVRPLRGQVEMPDAPETIELDEARRQKLIGFIENNGFIPADRKKRIIERLRADRVPAEMVRRIESRMGG